MKSKSVSGATALSLATFTVLSATPAFAQLRAFGEAEGYGAVATGGRGGTTVYHVTNLNDTGAGSFRDAVSGSNRIVVFDVAGEIKLKSGISAQSNLTIAGQTAPGAGITVTGYQAIGFTQRTNVIMRYMRLRPGDGSPGADNGMSMTRTGTAILDHVSIQFGKYNNIDAVAQTADTPRITIQNSIIANPIDNGTSNRGQGFGAHLEAVNGYYTISNNLWANSHSRNPMAKVNDQFKNNVDYNTEIGYLTSGTSTQFDHDVVNNAFIFGPASTSSGDFGQLSTPDKFYQAGNVQDTNKDGVWNPTGTQPVSDTDSRRSLTPLHPTTLGLPTLSVADAYAYVTAHAGSSLARDALDNLVIGQVQTLGAGAAGYTAGTAGPKVTPVPLEIESPDVGHTGMYHSAASTGLANNGLGVTATSARPAGFDVDNDGVADAWETAHGMNPALASDAFAYNPLGYRMIEQYINELGNTNDAINSVTNSAYTSASTWGGTIPTAMNVVNIRGNGAANGVVTHASGAAVAMELNLGGNGPAAGESLTVSGGTLSVYDTVTVGELGNATLNISGGTVNAWNVQLGNTLSGTTYTGILNLSGGTLLVDQIARGGGTAGNWNTGGQVNFTGGTIKAAGVLTISAPMALGTAGGTIDTAGFDGTVSGTLSDAAGSNGGLTKTGVGTLTLTGTNTNTGVTKISAGTLAINALTNGGVAGNLGAATNAAANLVLDGGVLKNVGSTSTSTDRAFTLTNKGGTLDSGTTGQVTFNGTADVAQAGTGNRTLTLTGNGASSFFSLGLGDPTSGKTSLTLVSSGSTSARWLIGASASPRTYSGDTTVTSGTLLTNANNVLPSGVGKGNVVVNGTLEMNGNNSAINALNGVGVVNQRGSTNRTLTLGNGNATGGFSGVIGDNPLSTQGVLNVTKTGTGTQTFTGANTYDGNTTINAGTLVLGPASYATVLANAGGLDVQNGKAVFDYGTAASPLTQIKSLLTSGYANGFATGQIRNTAATSARGLGYDTVGTTVVVLATFYGDADLNGTVDFNDFLALQTNFGQTGTTFAQGNFNYDGATDFNDFLILQTNFGQVLSGPAVAVSAEQVAAMTAFATNPAVPEPTTMAVMALAGAGLLRRRKGR